MTRRHTKIILSTTLSLSMLALTGCSPDSLTTEEGAGWDVAEGDALDKYEPSNRPEDDAPARPDPVGMNWDDPNAPFDRFGQPTNSPDSTDSGEPVVRVRYCQIEQSSASGEVFDTRREEFDALGRLTSFTHGDYIARYTYGERGLLLAVSESTECEERFTYDGVLLTARQRDCDGELDYRYEYGYDEASRLVSEHFIERVDGETTRGLRAAYTYPSPLTRFEYSEDPEVAEAPTREYYFSAPGRLSRIVEHRPAFGGPDYELRYEFDERGRLTGLVNEEAKYNYRIERDERGRVTAVAVFGDYAEFTRASDVDVVYAERDERGVLERVVFFSGEDEALGEAVFEGESCEREAFAWLRLLRTLSLQYVSF